MQHLAFEVDSCEVLISEKARPEAMGIEVVGPTNHTIFHSIYFFDPNGHRLELAWNDPEAKEAARHPSDARWEMLEEWSRTKRAPKQGRWAHESEFEAAVNPE